MNDKGDLPSFHLTAGNISDSNKNLILKLTKELWGKLFGDKGYISQQLLELLLTKSVHFIHLITGIRSNMKNKLIDLLRNNKLCKFRIDSASKMQFRTISQQV